ncbi:hypothetical protein J7K99_04165, partial [bacterium]|nr:hypothetical protein [bacterium]
GDNGTNVIVKWKHFETVPGMEYEVYRSEEGGEYQLLSPLPIKSITPVWEETKRNDVSDWGFYLIAKPVDEKHKLVDLQVVKLTDENRDSLLKLGAEKIVRVEFEVPPPEKLKQLPNYFCEREFYQVIADTSILNKPQPSSVPAEALKQFGVDIPVSGNVGVEVSADESEKEFVARGNCIVPADSENPSFLAKYGKKITSIVTEKARYTVKWDDFTLPDRSTKPGKKYKYKIRLYQVKKPIKKVFAESEEIEIVPKNEPPFAPTSSVVLYDTTRNEFVVHFRYPPDVDDLKDDFDAEKFVIFITDSADTECQNGKPIDTVGASWKVAKEKISEPLGGVYVEVIDTAGQTARTNLLRIVPSSFETPPIPKGLHVCDNENDNGTKIAMRWGPPELAVGYMVEPLLPKTKTIDLSDKNLYVVKTESGDTVVQLPDTAEIPAGAHKILSLSYSLPGDQRVLKIEYDMRTNYEDKALYPEFVFDGTKKPDPDVSGMIKFDRVENKKYKLKGWIVKTNGGRLTNPEANVEMEIDATQVHTVEVPTPPYVYFIYRAPAKYKDQWYRYELVGIRGAGSREFIDVVKKVDEESKKKAKQQKGEEVKDFVYLVQVMGPDGFVAYSDVLGPVEPVGNWFHRKKMVVFIATVIFVAVALYFFYHAKKGKEFYIRPIAGIVHIDEALGRATEMGRPIIYVTGLGVIDQLATLASITILGRVARKAAEYQTKLLVPCYDPVVMIVAQETVRNAYMDVGRPDLYKEENIFYIAAQQFAYAAAVSGLMIREKSAANFFIGQFFAESLILAETGASTGAIQVAGTDDMTQLPFFITACDYTIIGEELYAASAYMSNDPMQKGSLKAQDFLKAIEMIIIVLGTAAVTGGMWWFKKMFEVVGE